MMTLVSAAKIEPGMRWLFARMPLLIFKFGGRWVAGGYSAGGVVGGGFGEEADGLLSGFAAGSRVAGYRLEEQIGAGGMAVVSAPGMSRLTGVALKILAPALAADEVFRRRFMSEARAAASVDDPHIIPVYEAGEAVGALFIAMRYVSGGDVRRCYAGRLSDHGPRRGHYLVDGVGAGRRARARGWCTGTSSRPTFWSMRDRACAIRSTCRISG